MALAQKSYMDGATSPSSLIHTACFFVGAISVVVAFVSAALELESATAFSVAMEKVAKIAKKRNILENNFMMSMYKDCFYKINFFVKKNTLEGKKSKKTGFFFRESLPIGGVKCIIYCRMLQKTYER